MRETAALGCFLLQSSQRLAVLRELRRQDLDGDPRILRTGFGQASVERFVNDTHAAAGYPFLQNKPVTQHRPYLHPVIRVLAEVDGDPVERALAVLAQVGLADRSASFADRLSGGEQQRVGIARAIVGMPPILLADEPTGNLDPDLSQDLFNLFLQLNRQGVTVLIASHDLALIRSMGQRVLVLSGGRLVDDISAAEIRGAGP